MSRLSPVPGCLLVLLVVASGDAWASDDSTVWSAVIEDGALLVRGATEQVEVPCAGSRTIGGEASTSAPGAWSVTVEPGAWRARCESRDEHSVWSFEVAGRRNDPTITVDVEVRALVEYTAEVEQVVLGIGQPRSWDRAWRWSEVGGTRVLDRWMPRRVDTDGITLQSDAPSLEVRATDAGGVVRVQLDHAAEHPAMRYRRCAEVWAPELEQARDDRGARRRAVGERRSARTWVHLGGLPRVAARRWPDGRDAALVFTDHADPGAAARLDTIAWGSQQNAAREQRQPEGLLGHGLRWTQTVFTHRHRGYTHQVDDPAFRDRLAELVAAGVDVGPHSPSGGPDPRSTVTPALHTLEALADSQTWIDHQPTTNCEALASQGRDPGPWSITSELEAAGYRYAWATLDVHDRVSTPDIWQVADHVHRPVLYPGAPWVVGGPPSWWFTSQWRAVETERFVRAYRPELLDVLEARHGLHIAHTYLMSRGSGPQGALWGARRRRAAAARRRGQAVRRAG